MRHEGSPDRAHDLRLSARRVDRQPQIGEVFAWHDGEVSVPVFGWLRPRLGEADRRQALAVISPAERERYEAAPHESFLAGRLVLRRLVAELTGIEPATVDLVAVCPDCRGPHGKPTLVGSTLHLSLAHGRDAVVAAASWGAAVGVDLESVPSAAALEAIGTLAGEKTLLRWTRVEAILKADGRGLRVDPRDVVVGEREGWVVDAPTRYRLSEVELAPDVTVSVAVAS
jgi:4'-phosphopantetheinyl transferase